jgi:hypothetical protein
MREDILIDRLIAAFRSSRPALLEASLVIRLEYESKMQQWHRDIERVSYVLREVSPGFDYSDFVDRIKSQN